MSGSAGRGAVMSRLRSLFCRQRPDHTCRAAGCPGRGDELHLMCPDHRATGPVRDDTRRWLVNPGHGRPPPAASWLGRGLAGTPMTDLHADGCVTDSGWSTPAETIF